VNGTAARRRVLCVDDNAAVAEALRIKLGRSGRFEWVGWLPAADRLIQLAATLSPALVVLDLDMPGADPFAQIAALREHSPDVRVVVFSGHVGPELVEKALEAGAWGYASKSDGEDDLLEVLDRVGAEEIALSPEARAAYDRL